MGLTVCATSVSQVSQGGAGCRAFPPLRHCATCATPYVVGVARVERRKGASPQGGGWRMTGPDHVAEAARLTVPAASTTPTDWPGGSVRARSTGPRHRAGSVRRAPAKKCMGGALGLRPRRESSTGKGLIGAFFLSCQNFQAGIRFLGKKTGFPFFEIRPPSDADAICIGCHSDARESAGYSGVIRIRKPAIARRESASGPALSPRGLLGAAREKSGNFNLSGRKFVDPRGRRAPLHYLCEYPPRPSALAWFVVTPLLEPQLIAFQKRRRRHDDPCSPDAVAEITAEILRHPPADRMTLFTAKMVELRATLVAANPGASLRTLSTRGQEAGLRILNAITAAAHREQQHAASKLESPTTEKL